MNCPHCQREVDMGWEKLRKRRRRQGLCRDCESSTEINEHTGKHYWLCAKHRVIEGQRAKVRQTRAAV